jgi:hypothetical protein
MPWLPFFIAEDDLPVLIDRFNQDEEIAYIVKDGPEYLREPLQVQRPFIG